jgi:RpiB/LacA/LacB family sugar-phosphate isomerase
MDAARVYVGSDHAGFSLRKKLIERLRAQGREVVDLGPDTDAACDYPEFAYSVANAVRGDAGSLGILVCATGQGMALAAGKVRGIRAVVPATVEAARLTRFDNNANILCIGSRLLSEHDAFAIVDTWLATGFAGGRHARRIAKIAAIETASAVVFVTESERLRLKALGVPGRIFDRDASLFSDHLPEHGRIKNALGWVSLPSEMAPRLSEIATFAREVRRFPLKNLVLLVEDDAHSPAAALTRACATSGLRVHVVGGPERGSNHATPVALHDHLQIKTTFVLVVGKPGACKGIKAAEHVLWSKLLDQCGGDAERAGGHFAAITTPDDRLAEIAREHRYRKVFVDAADLGEDFGLLGFEGLVPAALLGHDPARLVARATTMADACRTNKLEDNPGASLGILLGAMAKHGRHKLTLLLSKSLLPLGTWIAQVLTAATRGGVTSIVTTWGEPLLSSYPPDRIFVHVQADGEAPAATPEQMEALHGAGQPYIQIGVADRHELTAEIFRWQMAATVAGLVMGANPFLVAAPRVTEPTTP